jgi:GT2 family glycosyltransferase
MMNQEDRTLRAHIVIYNSDKNLLESSLESLCCQDPLVDVIIFDNGGANEEMRKFLSESETRYADLNLKVFTSTTNIGFCSAHNHLLSDAFSKDYQFSLVMNPDISFKPGALEKLINACHVLEDLHLVSGLLLLGDRGGSDDAATPRIDSRGILWTPSCRHLDQDHGRPLTEAPPTGELRRTCALTGALILVPKAPHERVVRESGEFFDEEFFAYREDAELGLRAAALGVNSFILDVPVATHYRGSPGTSRENPVVNYLSARNRFLLAWKYGGHRPGRPIRRFLRDALVVFAALVYERQLWVAIWDAWKLRRRMSDKGKQIRAIMSDTKGKPHANQ